MHKLTYVFICTYQLFLRQIAWAAGIQVSTWWPDKNASKQQCALKGEKESISSEPTNFQWICHDRTSKLTKLFFPHPHQQTLAELLSVSTTKYKW